MSTAYEYRIIRNDNMVGFDLEAEMNALGRHGWTIQSIVPRDSYGHLIVAMQRPLQDAPTPQDAP